MLKKNEEVVCPYCGGTFTTNSRGQIRNHSRNMSTLLDGPNFPQCGEYTRPSYKLAPGVAASIAVLIP